MKVALFTDTFLPQINGVTNTLSKLMDYYKTKNIEYLIFAPDTYSNLDSNVNVEKFASLKFILYPECRLSFPNIFRIKNTLLEFNPQVIHNITEFNMGIAGLTYGKKLGIPTISNYTTNFADYLKYYNLNIFENAAWNYMRWFHNQNDITLCPSLETLKLINEKGIKHTGIFSRGISTIQFNESFRSISLRKKFGINDKIVLLYVGRIAVEKDIDILAAAYNNIYNKYKNKVSLIITGDGPELEKYKRTFPKNTIFTGYKKGDELSEIYASSDIFVFPSPTETFGNVVLEAMASGIPVIAANKGGVTDTVKNGINGILFNAGNSLDLEKKIIELIENASLYNFLKSNTILTAKEKSWNKVFDNLICTYENIIYRTQDNKEIS
jgi:glycosyltransferase involved in cell wall biosynthesis